MGLREDSSCSSSSPGLSARALQLLGVGRCFAVGRPAPSRLHPQDASSTISATHDDPRSLWTSRGVHRGHQQTPCSLVALSRLTRRVKPAALQRCQARVTRLSAASLVWSKFNSIKSSS